MPKGDKVLRLEILAPGYSPAAGEIELGDDGVQTLDDIAIQAHMLVNDVVQSIRKAGPV